MKIILATALLLGLAACGSNDGTNNVVLSGSADLNLQDNLTQCEVRQNGTTIFVRQTGLDPYAMAFDAAVVYDDVWVTLNIADAKRTSTLTQTEIDIINGVQ